MGEKKGGLWRHVSRKNKKRKKRGNYRLEISPSLWEGERGRNARRACYKRCCKEGEKKGFSQTNPLSASALSLLLKRVVRLPHRGSDGKDSVAREKKKGGKSPRNSCFGGGAAPLKQSVLSGGKEKISSVLQERSESSILRGKGSNDIPLRKKRGGARFSYREGRG